MPITGTQLLWATNTTSDVFVDTTNNDYYVLLSGRWFRAGGAQRPVELRGRQRAAAGLRAASRRTSPAGAVLPTVAGTPQAQEAVIANSIPQTATVPLRNGPTFAPSFDGAPQFAPIPARRCRTWSIRRCRSSR